MRRSSRRGYLELLYLQSCGNPSLVWENVGLSLNSLAGHELLSVLDHETQKRLVAVFHV